MIDHISIAVRDLEAGGRFYEAVLATLGYSRMIARATTIGFGKTYPDFWINARPNMATPDPDSGVHICLRAPDAAAVEYTPGYYAAFVLDPDGNRIEAVTFIDAKR
jgi:catechol 2,3-dioxygenase-like lactoylglutathione lyase family enzyme